MNCVHKFWFPRITVKYTQWGMAPNHAQKLQDIGGSGRDVKLVFFRTVEVEFVDGKFPLVVGEGYPLVEGA